MGYYADLMVRGYTSGRVGMPGLNHPKTLTPSRESIANKSFSLVRIKPLTRSTRVPGTMLVVCEAEDPKVYWVWASSKVTVVEREFCEVLESNLDLNVALARLDRKLYVASDI